MTAWTPSQTAGPFLSIGMSWNAGVAAGGGAVLRGCVRDGAGDAVTDALLEFWSPGMFERALTDAEGCYSVRLGGAAHVDVSIFARGLMQRLVTRVYLADEDDELDSEVRQRLLAREQPDGDFVFDVWLQGDNETVFFSPWPS